MSWETVFISPFSNAVPIRESSSAGSAEVRPAPRSFRISSGVAGVSGVRRGFIDRGNWIWLLRTGTHQKKRERAGSKNCCETKEEVWNGIWSHGM
jgi:hypothetical protein